MPEGHTVRRHALTFAERFVGGALAVSSPQGRFADGAALLDGTVLERADAAGKHLFLAFAGRRWLHVHLGLYGAWTFGTAPAPPPRGAVRVRLCGPGDYADLRGPIACEVLTGAEVRALLKGLGPDPLRRERGRRERFVERLGRSRAPLATLLMDQAVVAGVGNVYRAEALFRARLSPDLPGYALDGAVAGALWDDVAALLRDGVRSGRIVTTLPTDRPVGARRGRPRREDAHYVYRRTGLPCRICGTPVAARDHGGRNLYWCRTCQPA